MASYADNNHNGNTTYSDGPNAHNHDGNGHREKLDHRRQSSKSLNQPFRMSPHRRSQPFSPFSTHLIAALAEFVGTFMFLFTAYAGNIMAVSQAASVASGGSNSAETVLVISLAYGISLLVTVWTFYRISGGLFNPAVSLALALCGGIHWHRALVLFPTQLIASMAAGGLVKGLFPAPVIMAQTTLAPGVTIVRGLFIEVFLTALFIFTILMLAVEKSKDTFIAPLGIGLALFAAEIPGVFYTGGSLNPARSFGVAVAAKTFPGYHWIYWVGPLLGALLASGFYHLVKFLRYEDVNPGQDSSRENSEA